MSAHSSILAWRIPWTEKPGMLQFMGSQRLRHDWMTEYTQSNRPGVLIRKENEVADTRLNRGHMPIRRTRACTEDTHPYRGHVPIRRTRARTEDAHPYRRHVPVQRTLTRTEDTRLYGRHVPVQRKDLVRPRGKVPISKLRKEASGETNPEDALIWGFQAS